MELDSGLLVAPFLQPAPRQNSLPGAKGFECTHTYALLSTVAPASWAVKRSKPLASGKTEGKPRVTAWEVARDAAVSQSAVSRAFAGGSGVSTETRQRILASAKRLGYQPNALARGLITSKSGIVGIVIADLANPFLSGALEKLSRKLKAAGLTPFLITADNEREVGEAIPALEQYRVDGCFVICSHLSRDVARKYRDLGSAVLLFNRSVPGLGGAAVSIDDVAAGRAVADLLADAGHRHVAFLHGMRGASTDRDRYQGFATRLAERGVPTPTSAWGGYTYAGGARSIRTLMTESQRPTAVFCANDIMAMGAMDAARHDLGLRIPEDLAVVGFDDAPPAAWPSYDLTTIRQPVEEMIDEGIELLVGDDASPDSRRRVIAGELVIRSSVAACKP